MSIPFSFLLMLIISYYTNVFDINTNYVLSEYSFEPQTVHAEGNQYTCEVCNKSFALRTTFSSHWRTHKQESQYSSNMCSKSFYDKGNLTIHERLCHEERPICCGVCNKPYSDQSNLKKHLHMYIDRSIEGQYCPHCCDLCKKSSVCKSNMTQHHQHLHGEGHQFKCYVCNKSFTILHILKDINCYIVKTVDINVIHAVCHLFF